MATYIFKIITLLGGLSLFLFGMDTKKREAEPNRTIIQLPIDEYCDEWKK